jgi:hypothetical protein
MENMVLVCTAYLQRRRSLLDCRTRRMHVGVCFSRNGMHPASYPMQNEYGNSIVSVFAGWAESFELIKHRVRRLLRSFVLVCLFV